MPHTTGTARTDQDSAAEILHIMNAYRKSQVLYVATCLGLADHLSGARSAEELARETGAHAPSLLRLLRALTTWGIVVEAAPGQFALTEAGACLRADAADSVRDMVLMTVSEDFWSTWGDLLHSVQTGESAMRHLYGASDVFAYYAQHPTIGARMNAGFTAYARRLSRDVLAAFQFPDTGTVVDVGGGQGQLLAAILSAHAGLSGILFDRPNVVEQASLLLRVSGVADRCRVIGGDMFAEIPTGGDIYVLSRVIHDWDDARADAILKHCHVAMRPGTLLVMIDTVLPDHLDVSTRRQEQALDDLNMLVRTGGRERTEGELRALLGGAGFTMQRILPTSSTKDVVISLR